MMHSKSVNLFNLYSVFKWFLLMIYCTFSICKPIVYYPCLYISSRNVIMYIWWYLYVCKIILHVWLPIKIIHCIDTPCSVKSSGRGGGFAFCSPKYIIKKSICKPYVHYLCIQQAYVPYAHKINILQFFIRCQKLIYTVRQRHQSELYF